ncbi:13350_t:CDS:10 [Acaulospora morrowiae]|uniref:13350_t:CDS:1 n=1 Tax=Acaulospora morrowiae TaxID=94023 RepID=A0A9N8ZT86_9GLOM|nr:13350_t:CDS:10 [Acaulospora morrowiae]
MHSVYLQMFLNEANLLKHTDRKCTYDLSASSKRGRSKSEVELLQEQIEDIQTIQFQQLNQMKALLDMAVVNDPMTSVSDGYVSLLNQRGIEQNQGNLEINDGLYGWYRDYPSMGRNLDAPTSLNQIHSEETLHSFMEFSSKLPKSNSSMQARLRYAQDPVDQLVEQLNNNLTLESTRYVGPASLLLIDNYEEQIIPQRQDDLSSVEGYLKVLPNPEIADSLIDIYFHKICRHFPHLRKKVVLDCLKELSTPQQFLLLNSIFFAASPFHPDENLRDGGIYHQRTNVFIEKLALLQRHCLIKPHVLTVISLFILGLHTRTMGSAWIFHGMGTKMAFELGLHRKVKSQLEINDRVKEIRDMAFWGCFAAETWVSACYGRPSAMDESAFDVDLLPISSDPNPDEDTRLDIAWALHINLLRIFSQVRKYLSSRSKTLGNQREESQFRFLDAALGKWFHNLPNWLRFEEMLQDVEKSLLGSIGGEMHTLYWMALILLHSRNMTMFTVNSTNFPSSSEDSSRLSSQTMCIQAATILFHWLEVLFNLVPDFYEHSCTALFSFAPAIRILSWVAQQGDKKSEMIVKRLNEIKNEVRIIARRRFVVNKIGEGRLDGEERLKRYYANTGEETKKDVQYAMPENDQYKDYSHTRKRNNKNWQKQRIPMWGEDGQEFDFTFSLDNYNNENSPSTLFQYGSDVAQYPAISNFSYAPQIVSESTSPDSSNPQLFYTTPLMEFSNPEPTTNSNNNLFSFDTTDSIFHLK